MRIVFGSHPFEPRKPDPAFQDEYDAAVSAGLEVSVVSMEGLLEEQSPERAVRWIAPLPTVETAMFRGFMLTEEQYTNLFNALMACSLQLINTPEQYAQCHYLPNHYDAISRVTPATVWFEYAGSLDVKRLQELIAGFGDEDVIVKDYVKSEKHHWDEACFIPWDAGPEHAESVVRKFLELRGPSLNRGLVLRQFCPLAKSGDARKAPADSIEARLFFYKRRRLALRAYWDAGASLPGEDELDACLEAVSRIDSNFFTVDVAKSVEGYWFIMELGDGQVAGLPPGMTPADFYAAIAEA